ncbi:MAG TPA: hypothetical protein VJM50_24035 [Pyrinomonadaceae bacterium]|nr:hypothetical protein [Pyrinomonadaceae bacterium]
MSAGKVPDSPAMKALYRATWFLVHEADTRAAKGDAEAAQSFYAAIPFLAEVRKELTAPVEAWPKVEPAVSMQGIDPFEARAAIRTLEYLGYKWNGGSMYRPPIGKAPDWNGPCALIGDVRAMAQSWLSVCETLDAIAPDWLALHGCARDRAVATIRRLANGVGNTIDAGGCAPIEVVPNNGAATLAELRKLFMVPEGHDLLVHAKVVADQWMAVGAPAAAPADMVLVPRELTADMFDEGEREIAFGNDFSDAWGAAIAAAPAAQVAYPSEDHGCIYENGDGICRECADLAAANKAAIAAAQVAEHASDEAPNCCLTIPDWALARAYRLAVSRIDPEVRVSALVFASDVTVAADMLSRRWSHSVKNYLADPRSLSAWLRVHYRSGWDELENHMPEILAIHEALASSAAPAVVVDEAMVERLVRTLWPNKIRPDGISKGVLLRAKIALTAALGREAKVDAGDCAPPIVLRD